MYTITCCSRPRESVISNNDGNYEHLHIVGVEVFLRYSQTQKESLIWGDKENNSCLDSASVGSEKEVMVVDAQKLSKQLLNQTLHSILTVNECVILQDNNVEVVGRVSRVCLEDTSQGTTMVGDNTTNASAAGMVEPFRGRVGIHTEFYISASSQGPYSELTVLNPRVLTERALPQDVVHITTSDGEWFPIRRVLLAPCIKLTHCVQAGRGKYQTIPTLSDEEKSPDAPKGDDGRPHVKINIDCCTFDRVLLFILSILYPEEHSFALDLSEINTLMDAAKELGLQSLEDMCSMKTSSFHSRVRKDQYIRFEEVKRRNNGGELLIVLDGMVSFVYCFNSIFDAKNVAEVVFFSPILTI